MKALYCLRGLPGSGKTTVAKDLAAAFHTPAVFAADDYFYDKNGNYNFDVRFLGDAHDLCFKNVKVAMKEDIYPIIVHNTSTAEWEIDVYKVLAEQHGYKFFSLIVENRHGNSNVHGAPEATIEKMRRRFSIQL